MIAARSLAMHTAVLAVAGILALRTWTKDEEVSPKHVEAEVWAGPVEKLERITYESEVGTVTIEPRKDSQGRYYLGTVLKNPDPNKEAAPAPDPAPASADAGAVAEAAVPQPAPPEQPRKPGYFIATKEGEELAAKLAPLKAFRVLGKIGDDRKAEFGLDSIEGTLRVKIGGKEHVLLIGGSTPGGSDRYVKDPETGEAYVIAGSIVRDVTGADARLVERKLHSWEPEVVKRVKLTAGERTRELVRSADKKDFWASPESPESKDETASNWMSKVERLRITRYDGEKLEPPVSDSDLVVRLEYFDERKPIGFLELVRRPAEEEDRPEYAVTTEHTRWYGTVLRSTAEQVDQDVKSVLGE